MSKKICFNTNLIYFVVLSLFVVLRILSNNGIFDFMGVYASYYLSLIIQIGLIFGLPILLLNILERRKNKDFQTFKFLNYNKTSSKMILISFCFGIVIFLLNIYVSSFFNTIIQLFGYKPGASSKQFSSTWWTLLLDLICTAVLPAICEETLHRGMLLRGNSIFGMKKAIMISGILFGLLHLNIEQFFYASIIGLFLGYVCWCTNSIYPCIIIHFMNNALSVVMSFAAERGINIMSGIVKFFLANPLIGFIMILLVLVILLIISYELLSLMLKETLRINFGKKKKELATQALRASFFNQIEALKNNEQPAELTKQVIYIDAEEFLKMVSNEMMLSENKETENIDKNLDLKIKILLYGSLILSGLVTLMTFIWGLLR